MIVKSHMIENDVRIISKYKAFLVYGENEGFKKDLKKNIKVNCVSPGFIVSDMTAKISEEHTEFMKSRISLNKFGNPEDVANTIAFLSSNLSNYITGETIHVNGGMYFS